MPAKPAWYRQLPYILEQLRQHPLPFVDRLTVEFLLGVGRRRAQQIMAPCITHRVGSNGLADRTSLIARLEQIAGSTGASCENERRLHVAKVLNQLRSERLSHPRLLVEAPVAVLGQQFDNLPPDVEIQPGRIAVEFATPQQGLEKLLALAMAISNDFERFEHMVRAQKPGEPRVI